MGRHETLVIVIFQMLSAVFSFFEKQLFPKNVFISNVKHFGNIYLTEILFLSTVDWRVSDNLHRSKGRGDRTRRGRDLRCAAKMPSEQPHEFTESDSSQLVANESAYVLLCLGSHLAYIRKFHRISAKLKIRWIPVILSTSGEMRVIRANPGKILAIKKSENLQIWAMFRQHVEHKIWCLRAVERSVLSFLCRSQRELSNECPFAPFPYQWRFSIPTSIDSLKSTLI